MFVKENLDKKKANIAKCTLLNFFSVKVGNDYIKQAENLINLLESKIILHNVVLSGIISDNISCLIDLQILENAYYFFFPSLKLFF